jgi:hypothetical protein
MLVLPITQTVIDTLQKGMVIRKSVTWALRVLALLTVLGGIYILIELLKTSFQLPTSGTIGGLMAAGLLLLALAITVQILLARAVTVDELGESDFTVIPIISVLARAAGEIGATFALTSGIGGCLFFWFSGMSPAGLLPMAEFAPFGGGGNAFLGGVMFFASMAVLSFFCLVLGYFAAEAWLVMVDIARNIRLLVIHAGADQPAAPAPAARPAAPRAPSMSATRPPVCPQCGTRIEPGDQFCGGCGRPFSK